MADINKCDIEGETRTAYRLKEGVDWLEVKDALINMWFDEKGNPINSDLKFNSLFEAVELPVVELKESDTIDGREINGRGLLMWKVVDGDYSAWGVELEHERYGISAKAYIGESELIKSIEDFNNRAAMLFGFYLKEPEGAEK